MKAFDWQRWRSIKVPVEFLAEVALRSLYTFVGLYFPQDYRTARRAQMSLFEVLIILTSARRGDVAFMTMCRCCRCWCLRYAGATVSRHYVADGA
ncbi:inner membrane protein [Klebsiella pneumoniae]|uniref:Inner membrane protein n=1 Tax=Klebsiella pneumoniae TaxID=573 RepID=A0A378F8S1_KLEPN|nr:inner membrane protein [Klebsiella pneumoniae]